MDFNAVMSATINFLIVAAVVYFVIMFPTKSCEELGKVEQAQDTELSLLDRDPQHLWWRRTAQAASMSADPAPGPAPTPRDTSADRS